MIPLMRRGEPMASDVGRQRRIPASHWPCSCMPSVLKISQRITLNKAQGVDSVINSGKSTTNLAKRIREVEKHFRTIVNADGVMYQEQAASLDRWRIDGAP